jgi:hypothetical protein
MNSVFNFLAAAGLIIGAYYIGWYRGWAGCHARTMQLFAWFDSEGLFDTDKVTAFLTKYKDKL